MLSHNCLNSTNRYVALDVETTGLSPQNGDRVIEIGAVAIEDQSIIAEFSSLIDVDKGIPWQVRQVHGITNEMLEGEPKPDVVLPEFYKFIAGSILVAHNASFDIRTDGACFIKKSVREKTTSGFAHVLHERPVDTYVDT